MHEDRGAMIGGGAKHALDTLVIQAIAVHRGKQADGVHLEVLERPLQHRVGIQAGRVVHEEADEPVGMVRNRLGDRRAVAGNARDQRRARDTVAIELGHPAVPKLGGRPGRIPLQLGSDVVRLAHVRRQQLEETCGEEMTVGVVDHVPSSRCEARGARRADRTLTTIRSPRRRDRSSQPALQH